ncbi:poly(3-hydroxyalkanoate) granule-associated protein PhaI [Pseudomonas sp. Bc-h]|jgi:poly(hydroxyalkanoate) granule-associated protein|uniref:phasin family protein n=1 Tax=unclassified Pseudomonas TaxID=196821 RepID=UPI0009DB50F4|nr:MULTISPECIES: phasin family protein [unclassified Pseudomonas]MDE1197904.1 phasin family protein [Pseudomonas sp.]OQR37629.1 poly(3-hydroxyalkanoate) granule-associated protein PhaI [Pseudomonas sp. Bc-h]
MVKVTLKKKIEAEEAKTFSEVRLYARKIWLAGLGAYVKAGQEGADYVKELIKTGEQTEKKAKKVIDEKVEAANSEIDSAKGEFKGEITKAKGRVEVQLDKIESAFDRRVASALNRIGIPSKHDVETLSAKLDELTALLERVARKQ